jgi:hypothetical protein
MASASAIGDELVTILEAMTGTSATKSGYSILDTSSDRFVFVVRPSDLTNSPAAHSGNTLSEHTRYTMLLEGFVKDLGDPADYMTAQWTMINNVQTTIDDYSTLNSTCDFAFMRRAEMPEYELNIQGQMWQPIRFWIDCTVLN